MVCTTCKEDKADTEFRAGRRRCNDCRWLIRRCQNHGITLEDFHRMYESQRGLCAICGQPQTRVCRGKVLPLYIDHDHKTGRARGLLCAPCNTAIGLLEEDPERFQKALAYMEAAGSYTAPTLYA